MSPWHFCEALADVRLSFVRAGIHASCTARFVLSSYCVRVQTVPRLDRDRPNVKRNFTARLRAIALSLPDTPGVCIEIVIALAAGHSNAQLHMSACKVHRDVWVACKPVRSFYAVNKSCCCMFCVYSTSDYLPRVTCTECIKRHYALRITLYENVWGITLVKAFFLQIQC